jgi:hypothetical protein
MSTKPSRQDSLLAALQRKTSPNLSLAAATPPQPVEADAEPVHNAGRAEPARRMGKPIQFWLHDADRKTIRELSAWLAGQGIRPSDSMVVRAALQMARPGPQLLECYRGVASLDGRLKAR